MKEKRVKCEMVTLVLLFALAATTLLAGTVTAVPGMDVTRVTPADLDPDAEFDVKLTISAELPLVAGIVDTIPKGFSFVSTTHPPDHYSVLGQEIAFAVINVTEIKYTVKAPSSGEGTFTGEWVDMLSEKEGDIADTTVIVGDGDSTSKEEEEVTVTPTPTLTPTPTPASEVPGFEFVFTMAVLLIVCKMVFRNRRKRGKEE